jgi:uncharacterized protein YihD (DUF1040 family)
MRNPERIPKILKILEEIWLKNPDMRLGQLIENVFPNRPGFDAKLSRPAYFVEDEEFIETLQKSYETKKIFSYGGEKVLKSINIGTVNCPDESTWRLAPIKKQKKES